jgi:hypothetical protein
MCHKKFSYLLKICFPVLMHGTKFQKLGKICNFSFLLRCHPLFSSFFYRNIPSKILVFNCLCSNLNLLLSFLDRPKIHVHFQKVKVHASSISYMLYKNSTNWKFHYVNTRRKDISRYFS